jgi:hypothetical protein
MSGKSDPNERFEGIDRRVLDADVWADTPAQPVCAKCGLALDPGAIRCPRCNAFVLTGCGGSCASCGARSCARRKQQP